MNDVLVLNKAWAPVRIVSLFEAVCKLYASKAYALDETYAIYSWEDWVSDWNTAERTAKDMIVTSQFNIPRPKIIILKDYKGFVFKQAKLNRRNLFARDRGVCQYCGYKGEHKDFNLDHVYPQARGGKTTWQNAVLSCFSCNSEKGCRTPEEAGMKLLRKPFRPRWTDLQDVSQQKNFSDWKELLGEMYWNVELDET